MSNRVRQRPRSSNISLGWVTGISQLHVHVQQQCRLLALNVIRGEGKHVCFQVYSFDEMTNPAQKQAQHTLEVKLMNTNTTPSIKWGETGAGSRHRGCLVCAVALLSCTVHVVSLFGDPGMISKAP